MKIIDLKKVSKGLEPLCPECKVLLQHEINIYPDDAKVFQLNPKTDNAWFECPKCRKYILIEDYTNRSKHLK